MCEKLLRDGHSVRILDNFSSGKEANLAAVQADVEILDGDVREEEMVGRAVKDVDIIVHHAAIASVAHSVENPILEHEAICSCQHGGSVRRRSNTGEKGILKTSTPVSLCHLEGFVGTLLPRIQRPVQPRNDCVALFQRFWSAPGC